MNVYVALHDPAKDGDPGDQSFVLGAFSSEALAQQACQDDADVNPGNVLEWTDAEAEAFDGTRYAVVLVDLDTPV